MGTRTARAAEQQRKQGIRDIRAAGTAEQERQQVRDSRAAGAAEQERQQVRDSRAAGGAEQQGSRGMKWTIAHCRSKSWMLCLSDATADHHFNIFKKQPHNTLQWNEL